MVLMQTYEWICIDAVIRAYDGKKLKTLVNREYNNLNQIEKQNKKVIIGLLGIIAIINVSIPVTSQMLDNPSFYVFILYTTMQFLLLTLLIFAFFRLN